MNTETRNITLNIPEECIQEFLLSVPQVEKIIIKRHGNLFDITTVIDKDDREARYKIYELEGKLIDNLENYLFDFHTIIREGRKLEDIITAEPANIYSKE